MGEYKGNGIKTKVVTTKKMRFNLKGFFLWLASIVVSLAPVYIAMLNQIRLGKGFETKFWFSCFGEYDGLWVFGTVLLFCCCSSFSNQSMLTTGKRNLSLVGIGIFVLIEGMWLFLKCQDFSNTTTDGFGVFVTIGAILSVVALALSIPLQIMNDSESGV